MAWRYANQHGRKYGCQVWFQDNDYNAVHSTVVTGGALSPFWPDTSHSSYSYPNMSKAKSVTYPIRCHACVGSALI